MGRYMGYIGMYKVAYDTNKAKPDQEAPLRAILGIVHAHHFRGGKWGKLSGSRLSTISKFASIQFLSPDPKRIGGYSDQPGVRPSVRLSVRLSVRRQKLVRSITFIPFEIF